MHKCVLHKISFITNHLLTLGVELGSSKDDHFQNIKMYKNNNNPIKNELDVLEQYVCVHALQKVSLCRYRFTGTVIFCEKFRVK